MASRGTRQFGAVGLALALALARPAAAATPDELVDAAKRGKLDLVDALLKQGVDPNLGDKNGETALMEASRTGKADVVKALLAAGARPDLKNKKGETAAMRAVFAAQAETLALLVAAGADVKATNAKGETALRLAIQNGSANVRPEMIGILVKAGADAGAETFRGEPALIYSIESFMERQTEGLLKAGLDPNVKSRKGSPALVLAAGHCNLDAGLDMVAKLVAFGADVNARDERGRSALEKAVDLTSVDYGNVGTRDSCAKVAYILASRGADDPSVLAARDVIIKKGYALFDTMVVRGQQEARAPRKAPAGAAKAGGAAAGPPDAKAPAAATRSGGFRYAVAGAGEDALIDGGPLQYQSTSDELVIGLVQGGAARYAVSLFLPLAPAAGATTLKPYDGKAFKKGPTASIFIGSAQYYARSGSLALSAAPKGTITGSFQFVAQHESDPKRVVDVKGSFLEIPLAERKSR